MKKTYVPTVEELLTKPKRELDAVFRKAAETARDPTCDFELRVAATTTMENVRRSLSISRDR